MALPLLPKLFWGTVLVVGAGAGLRNSILSSIGFKEDESAPKTEIQLAHSTSQGNTEDEETTSDTQADSQNSSLVSSNTESRTENQPSTPVAPRKTTAPVEKKGCVIHQLESSVGVKWRISEVGTLDKLLKNRANDRINQEDIKAICDRSQGKDILVANRSKAWYARRQWDYFEEDQNHPQFKSYLDEKKK
ncbi:hypothetical protein HF1_06330 [Mycoplasma haemofelis str. Langford 1]|uniref:Uncharacterized protein n=1 Tax=Mycoplasma haemofelis (strain Langford 1) TaxID=941640 RepID=E8ZHM0_MYCHL|nr:hypothetical protein [Mycoplasma haemofelis]CBY92641.1 hypothetical protein HF1_06330 [Mycoplasma haemofelis str. Langford 1]